MVVSCPNCGQKLSGEPWSIGMCPKCKTRLRFPDELKTSEQAIGVRKKKKKWPIVLALLLVIVVACAAFVIPRYDALFLSDDEKRSRIMKTYFDDGYEAALQLVSKYYGNSSEEMAVWDYILSEGDKERLVNDLEIVEDSLTKDGKYCDYEAQIKNNSDQTITYMEINLYLMDDNENIIDTDWTNWSGSLPPGGSTYVDTMVEYRVGISKYRAEISSVSTDDY